jgi:electron transport complex protein RnfG
MELQKAIAEVLPAHDHYEEVQTGPLTLYLGKSSGSDSTVGIALEVVGSGFQGKISIMLGLSPDLNRISGIKILEQIETPGLGTKIVEDPTNKEDPFWFPNQFKSLITNPEIEIVKNIKPSKPTEIQAITGATITSKAVVNILNEHIKQLRKIHNGEAQLSRGNDGKKTEFN